ncbi:serine-threonine rich protein [Blastomyces gilchristii SLH14081]|uniref:Serine-threonine rich protein n=1 Tax=Blastomyces gilchristii (strain SLH14081) TaxID=559298 RepID=A0A179UK90_BLAGS|nr:serine-threonine rich protein [Blastomyces gilchristii SLH14081]OAT07639.1 serine-threonine rich protein [Blastomyces gilchristii SLH14081]
MTLPKPLILLLLAVQSIAVEVDSIKQSISVDGLAPIQQTVHRVKVGGDGGNTFEPNRLNANLGDQMIFKFLHRNHTLTQSSLRHPCTSQHQLDTGFTQFNPTGRTGTMVSFTVNSLDPQWFFCRQTDPESHCHAGMVFALNPGDQMDEFLRNAKRESDHAAVSTITREVTITVTSSTPATIRIPMGVESGLGASLVTGTMPQPSGSGCQGASMGLYRSSVQGTGLLVTGRTWRPTATIGSMPCSLTPMPYTSGSSPVVTAGLMYLASAIIAAVVLL